MKTDSVLALLLSRSPHKSNTLPSYLRIDSDLKDPKVMGFLTYIGMTIIIYYMIHLVLFFLVDCDIALAFVEKFGRNLSRLKGKVIWITEASSSVGEAMAYEIALNNGKMVLSSNRKKKLRFIKQKCMELNPYLKRDDILILAMDITKTETHQSCFNAVIRHFGMVDILINNSGKAQIAMWEDINLDCDRDLFKLNVFGIVSLCRTAVQYFRKKGRGHIVVLSSLAGIIGVPYSSSYAASLHAIHGYLESLRNEKLGTDLQITLIHSGPIACNISREAFSCSGNEKLGIMSLEYIGMTAKRCAHLAMLAVVNNLDEAWMASRPIIPLIYCLTHFPNLVRNIARTLSPKGLEWFVR